MILAAPPQLLAELDYLGCVFGVALLSPPPYVPWPRPIATGERRFRCPCECCFGPSLFLNTKPKPLRPYDLKHSERLGASSALHLAVW